MTWHPVALSSLIDPGTSAGTHVDGRELVVWRDNSGAAHVWEDRCPHRGMKLSFGFVRDDHIACLYHGWQYDGSGSCRYIPAHPDLDVPKTITVPVFAAHEAAGMVWTSLSAQPGEFSLAVGPVVAVASLYVACPAPMAAEYIAAEPPPPFLTGSNPADIVPADDFLFRVTTSGDTLLVGVQRLGPSRTALHIVIEGDERTYAGAAQAHFHAWAVALRHRLEAAAPAEAA